MADRQPMGGGDADSASPIGRAQMGRGCCFLETAGVEASVAPRPKLDGLPKLAGRVTGDWEAVLRKNGGT